MIAKSYLHQKIGSQFFLNLPFEISPKETYKGNASQVNCQGKPAHGNVTELTFTKLPSEPRWTFTCEV